VPALLQAVVDYVGDLIPPERLTSALAHGIQAMDANTGNGPSNADVFWAAFCPVVEDTSVALKDLLTRFYLEEFSTLRRLTRPVPYARSVVGLCFECGLQVVIASGMQVPLSATEQPLEWADVPVGDFEYAFVTGSENMHASKPHAAYYLEVLSHIAMRPADCLMVGDSWEDDIAPATSVGIPSYWIAEPGQLRPSDAVSLIGQGTLTDLFAWLKQTIHEGY